MPRSRTRAHIRAAWRDAGVIPRQTEWTSGRIGHLLRKIWKKAAAQEGYRIKNLGVAGRKERRTIIVTAMNKWGAACVAEYNAGKGD